MRMLIPSALFAFVLLAAFCQAAPVELFQNGVNCTAADLVVGTISYNDRILFDCVAVPPIASGGTGITSGADKQILFQDGTTVGENAGLTYDKSTASGTIGTTSHSGSWTFYNSANNASVRIKANDTNKGQIFLGINNSFGGALTIYKTSSSGAAASLDGDAGMYFNMQLNITTGSSSISPFIVDSPHLVTNLNADYLNDHHGSDYILTGATAGGGLAGTYPNPTIAAQLKAGGSAPAISACGGGSPAVVGTDNAGKITAGTGALASCVINFAATWANAPACTVVSNMAITSQTVTTSTTQLTVGGTVLTSDILMYTCLGY